jgi:rRNA-processing protein FCF1
MRWPTKEGAACPGSRYLRGIGRDSELDRILGSLDLVLGWERRVRLRDGKTYNEAIKVLDDLTQGGLNDVSNALPHIGSASFEQMMAAVLLRYERWTESAQKELRGFFIEESIADRLRADKYWIIVGSAPASSRTASMINTELSELRGYFADLANELRVLMAKYPQGDWLVLDTNDLLHYYRFDNIPWKSIYGKSARIAIPHVVVDEIDSKSYNSGPKIQQRARGVYRILETLLDQTGATGEAQLADGTPFALLTDESGHRRLPNNDDEIVSQALSVQQAVHPSVVTVVTRDIGMRARTMARGLAAAKLPDKYLIREEALASREMDVALSSMTAPEEESSAS